MVPQDTAMPIQDSDESSFSGSVSFSFQFFPYSKDRIRFYYGYGVRVAYDHRWSSDGDLLSDYLDRITLGPVAYVGVEWSVKDQIGISGEYGSQLYYSYSFVKFAGELIGDYKIDTHTAGFRQDNVRLGISVYF